MRELQVKIYRSLPYTPQTGGRFERMHQTVKDVLSRSLLQKEADGQEVTVEEGLDIALYIYKYVLFVTMMFF